MMMMSTPSGTGGAGDLDKDLQAEIDAALGDMSLDDLMMAGPATSAGAAGGSHRGGGDDEDDDDSGARRKHVKLEPGARIAGQIISVGLEDVFIEIGPKTQGICSIAQFTNEAPPRVGEEVEFSVIRVDRSEGLVYLGRLGAVQKAGDWDALAVGQIVEARCTAVNKGGLQLELGSGMRAFMPAGQVGLYHVDDLAEYIGQSLTCEVMDVNKEKKNLVLSRKAILKREQEEARKKTMESLAVGQVHTGTVRKIMPFGAFVDIGGVDGLVHIGEMSYSRVNKVEDVLSEGQQVQVQILKIEEDGKRIGLGMKQLQADPFTSATSGNNLVEGAEVTGRITKIADFGAFVELSPGVEGLIHISELSHERVNRVSQVVKPDEIVTVKVLSVDQGSRRIGLSLKAMKARQEEEMSRSEDKAMAKLRAKWGSDGPKLKGGIG